MTDAVLVQPSELREWISLSQEHCTINGRDLSSEEEFYSTEVLPAVQIIR